MGTKSNNSLANLCSPIYINLCKYSEAHTRTQNAKNAYISHAYAPNNNKKKRESQVTIMRPNQPCNCRTMLWPFFIASTFIFLLKLYYFPFCLTRKASFVDNAIILCNPKGKRRRRKKEVATLRKIENGRKISLHCCSCSHQRLWVVKNFNNRCHRRKTQNIELVKYKITRTKIKWKIAENFWHCKPKFRIKSFVFFFRFENIYDAKGCETCIASIQKIYLVKLSSIRIGRRLLAMPLQYFYDDAPNERSERTSKGSNKLKVIK